MQAVPQTKQGSYRCVQHPKLALAPVRRHEARRAAHCMQSRALIRAHAVEQTASQARPVQLPQLPTRGPSSHSDLPTDPAPSPASRKGAQPLLKKVALAAVGVLGAGLLTAGAATATDALAECAPPPQVVGQLAEPVTELLAPAQECLRNGLEWVVEESLNATNLTESKIAPVGPGGLWLANTPFCDVWDAYCTVLNERPLFTKIMTGMLGTFLGDLLAQTLSNFTPATPQQKAAAQQQQKVPGFQYDVVRTLRLLAYSALLGTPVAHWWFALLDAGVMPEAPTSLPAVLTKMALDQALMAPTMTALFFAVMKALEGSPAEAPGEVQRKLMPTMRANWAVWPLAHVINFGLVPPQQRILYINLISIAWTAYMSHMASGEEQQPAPQQGQPPVQGAQVMGHPAPGAYELLPPLRRAFSSSRIR